ncbi:hypothetical protein A3F34_00255 [Candidatus Roizmanbacteria bacterium RIFCSPHIGHO2_12_FULL_44_10]|uniref:Uncharacterized protein n=1 Tax=Candidatus Roizmanbacteria bacterium RIFCSPHIGHO2_12_FULL_44_10 TaxID=1802054 RepID=A0A1F7I6I8_9BACT|nr:MAG: hypothetical protein A3F34_00255 [Candidatus Roizmanbacteria bacterium RIFCSPHIGHO2_12_FULL_44_10]
MERPIRRVVESAVAGIALLAVATLPILAQSRKHTPNGCDIGRWHYFMQRGGVFALEPNRQAVLTVTLEDNLDEQMIMYTDQGQEATAWIHEAEMQEIICKSEKELLHDAAELAKTHQDDGVSYLSDPRGLFHTWNVPADPTFCVNIDSDDIDDPNWTEVVLSLPDDYVFTILNDHGVAQEIIVASGGNIPTKVDTYKDCNTVQERAGLAYAYGANGEYETPDEFIETVQSRQIVPQMPLFIPLAQSTK